MVKVRERMLRLTACLMISVLVVSLSVPHHHHGAHICVANEYVDFAELTVENHFHACPQCGQTDCDCERHHHHSDHDDDFLCQLNLKASVKAAPTLSVYRPLLAVFPVPTGEKGTAVCPISFNRFKSPPEEGVPPRPFIRSLAFRAPPMV